MRLVDADELIKILNEYENDEASKEIYGVKLRLILGDCKIEVNKLPVAYDVDKVIQKITEFQLKIQENFYTVEDEEYAVVLRGQLMSIADCLEIVKSGGVADE